jgi:hypothetical protein
VWSWSLEKWGDLGPQGAIETLKKHTRGCPIWNYHSSWKWLTVGPEKTWLIPNLTRPVSSTLRAYLHTCPSFRPGTVQIPAHSLFNSHIPAGTPVNTVTLHSIWCARTFIISETIGFYNGLPALSQHHETNSQYSDDSGVNGNKLHHSVISNSMQYLKCRQTVEFLCSVALKGSRYVSRLSACYKRDSFEFVLLMLFTNLAH